MPAKKKFFLFSDHRVRHHHDQIITNHRLTTSFPVRREFMKDEPRQPPVALKDEKENDKMAGATDFVVKIGGGILENSTITVDARSLIEQKTHNSELAKWEDAVKKYRAQIRPSIPNADPGDETSLIEHERRRQEEERMRRHEIEMRRWREELRRYHMEIKRLQEDSRRYQPG